MENNSKSIIRKFASKEEAKEVKTLLAEHGIQSFIKEDDSGIGVTLIGESYEYKVELIISNKDFSKAEVVLSQQAEEFVNNIDKDYYLFSFENEELYEILLKPDEWSEFDVLLTKKILKERGKDIDEDLISSLYKQRIEVLSKPEEHQTAWVILGYISSILGGFLGLIVGYFMWTSKKTLPNGQKVYTYSTNDRRHGMYMFYIGLIVFPILLVFKFIFNIALLN